MSGAGLELAVEGRRVFAGTGGRPFDRGLPTVAFLHGAGMDHSVWALQSRYLAHHGRAVLALYRRMEASTLDAVSADTRALRRHLRPLPTAPLRGPRAPARGRSS